MTGARAWLAAPALAAIALVLGSVSGPDAAPGPDRATGFDHVWHEGRVDVTGRPAIACTDCHVMDAQGRMSGKPGHASCFGSCHGAAPPPRKPRKPYALAPERERLCQVCHAPGALAAAIAGQPVRLDVAYPPYEHAPDHALRLSHAAHQAPSAERSGCVTCHPGGRAPARPGHAQCTSCHPAGASASAVPPMSQCESCHVREYGPRRRPALLRGAYPVTATFSHERHAERGAGDCMLCHEDAARASANDLPAPSMAICQRCHDGAQAFSAVGPTCRRCHTQPGAMSGLRLRLEARYDHAAHRSRLGDASCARCHALDPAGVPRPAAADHTPCSDSACHAREFASREPALCGACHVGIEPWRGLHADRPPRPDTEFGARFSHRAHVRERGMERACEACHERAAGQRERALGRDHRACADAGCHTADSGAPRLGDCEACHEPGLGARRQATRLSAPWSVRARFRHDTHRRTPAGQPMPCLGCHASVPEAATVDTVPTPSKATCMSCHDGATAFKVTGHDCARCHGPAGDHD